MKQSTKTLLKELGLSTSETVVYMSALKLGEATVSEIAHMATLPRTTTASILDRLQSEGYISAQKKQAKQLFWVNDPRSLVEKQKAKLQTIELLSSQLATEYHQADKIPTAEIYDSKAGLVSLIAQVVADLKKGETIWTIDAPAAKNYQAVMSDELFHAFSKQKIVKGVQTRALIPFGQSKDIRARSLQNGVQIRVMSEAINFANSLWVFGRSVVLFSGTHTFAVRVSNQMMADGLRSILQFIWQQSAELK